MWLALFFLFSLLGGPAFAQSLPELELTAQPVVVAPPAKTLADEERERERWREALALLLLAASGKPPHVALLRE
jgi:hypothetical protein